MTKQEINELCGKYVEAESKFADCKRKMLEVIRENVTKYRDTLKELGLLKYDNLTVKPNLINDIVEFDFSEPKVGCGWSDSWGYGSHDEGEIYLSKKFAFYGEMENEINIVKQRKAEQDECERKFKEQEFERLKAELGK